MGVSCHATACIANDLLDQFPSIATLFFCSTLFTESAHNECKFSTCGSCLETVLSLCTKESGSLSRCRNLRWSRSNRFAAACRDDACACAVRLVHEGISSRWWRRDVCSWRKWERTGADPLLGQALTRDGTLRRGSSLTGQRFVRPACDDDATRVCRLGQRFVRATGS